MIVGTTQSAARGLRMGGLVTGFDTKSLVRDLMRSQQISVDRLRQQRQVVEWRREEYREVTNLLRGFSDGFFNSLNSASNMLSTGTYSAMRVTSSDSSFVTATANAEAMEGTHTITGIDSLATPTTVLGRVGALPDSMTLNNSLETLGFAVVGSTINFEIAGRSFTFNSTDTMRHVMNTVNADATAGMRFFYSSIEARFMLQTKNTGAATSPIAASGAFLEDLGLAGPAATIINGTDASVRFRTTDGTGTVNVTRATNNFTIDGVTYSLLRQMPAGTGVTGVTLTVSKDTDRAFNAIKAFVGRYNQVIDDINGRVSEQRFRDYAPLTDAQREELSDEEIRLWEQRARSGLLQNNPMLQSVVSNMRTAITQSVQAAGISLHEIGITTGAFQERGRLNLDENRLRAALLTNSEQISLLFSNSSSIAYSPGLTAAQREQRSVESGIAHRLSDILQNNIRTTRDSGGRKGILLERAGIAGDITEFRNTLNSEIDRIEGRIDTAIERMARSEEHYWRQFNALEQAIQRMNSQSMWLAQQFGTGGQG